MKHKTDNKPNYKIAITKLQAVKETELTAPAQSQCAKCDTSQRTANATVAPTNCNNELQTGLSRGLLWLTWLSCCGPWTQKAEPEVLRGTNCTTRMSELVRWVGPCCC
jgi:hypothetical protein